MWKKILIAAVGAVLLTAVWMNGGGQINANGTYKNTTWDPLATPTPTPEPSGVTDHYPGPPAAITLPSGQVVPNPDYQGEAP